MKRNTARRWAAFAFLFALSSCDSEEPTEQNPQPEASQPQPSGNEPSLDDEPTPQEPSPEDEASTGEASTSSSSTSTGGDSGDETSSEDPGTDESTSEDDTGSTDDDGNFICSKLKVTGSNIGQVPMNLELVNAKGDKVSLHDHCNDVLYIAAATAY